MSRFLLILFIVLALAGCSSIAGDCPQSVNPNPSTITFEMIADSVIVTTQSDSWWLNGVYFNKKYFDAADYIIQNYQTDKYWTMDLDSLLIRRIDKQTLFVKVNENPNASQRSIGIDLQDGNCFDGIEITQEGKL